MKKIITLVFVLAMVLTACSGDQGPAGPPGIDGGVLESSAFEIEIDYNAANNFSHTENYGFKVLESDVTLVYISWETKDGNETWRLLPQNVIFDDGTLIYNFDFTQTYVNFFLDGTKDLSTLDAEWTQKQIYRVVVIPANNIGIDVSNLNDVMQAYNIENFEVK